MRETPCFVHMLAYAHASDFVVVHMSMDLPVLVCMLY